MNKPPAFQFYANDFLAGTFAMTLVERGLYITLLCRQWTQGHVTSEEMARLSDGMAQPLANHVFAKFKEASPGCFKNEKLEVVRLSQQEYRENRAKSGKLGAEKRWHSHSTAIAQPMANDSSPSPTPTPMQEREQNFHEAIARPTLTEVKCWAALTGLAPWKAEDWWNEMEGCGWLDFQHRPVQNWQAVLSRVKTKWESDGRPKTPPVNRQQEQQRKPSGNF
jgi:uncharacterized protein YdaU (DUF1376 family)